LVLRVNRLYHPHGDHRAEYPHEVFVRGDLLRVAFDPEVHHLADRDLEVRHLAAFDPEVHHPVESDPEVHLLVDSDPEVHRPVDSDPEVHRPVASDPEVHRPVASDPEVHRLADLGPKASFDRACHPVEDFRAAREACYVQLPLAVLQEAP